MPKEREFKIGILDTIRSAACHTVAAIQGSVDRGVKS